MSRFCLLGLVFAIFLGGTLGCGDSGPKKEQKDPFKARQDAAPPKKDKGGRGFMKPD